MASYIGRRKFLAALGGAVAGWPLAARAQQGERMRRIGVLMSRAAADVDGQVRIAAFLQGWLDNTLWSGWNGTHSAARRCSDAICNFCARWLRPGRKLCLCPAK
jgi:hypothetical protein